jgi:hypothetical protein
LSVPRILIGAVVIALSFAGALAVMNLIWPSTPTGRRPALAEVPPLDAITRSSVVVAPAALALAAIRDTIEGAAPRNLAGSRQGGKDLPLIGDIGWTVDRGPIAVSGRPDALAVSTGLLGTFRATGKLGAQVGNAVGGAVGNAASLLGRDLGRQVQDFAGKTFDQRVDVRGTVVVTSRPALAPTWRIVPNLTAQVNISDVTIPVAGFRLSASNEVKPVVDQSVRQQVAALDARVRNDPFLEQAARREWAKMCRAISLGAAAAGVPDLWLEIRPTRAFAAQPRVDANAVHLVIGVQAETRVVPNETKPNCPFPAQLELVPQIDKGRVAIGVPIDVPFTEVNKLLEAQLKDRSFPEDGRSPVEVTVRRTTIAASGDRLLISLVVKAREKKSWFSLGAEATLHIWGRPALDRQNQILKLSDIELDVESEAAFGLLGAAAQAARPQLRAALAERAAVDLKPFAADARKRVDAALAAFRQQQNGVRVDASVTDLRLVGVAFDAKTLRVIAEADGVVDVAVTTLAVP